SSDLSTSDAPIETARRAVSTTDALHGILRTTTGRVAAGLALAVVALFAALLLRPPQVVVPAADQPLVPIPEVTGVPTGGASLTAAADQSSCSWSSYQVVGKRWDEAGGGWVSVAAGAGSPEVVVTLEQLATCRGQITLTWSVQNNSDQQISFPLRSDNIQISDSLGNDYLIADDASQPRILRVAPGAKGRGVAVADRPVSRSASSLLVRLKSQPFGEASFVVSLQK
ncbi:MAG: NERD domain-containing protein, partial [Oscillochloris sp.]|nr:NERD domain-containing protein [Oscillochloris sp.]